MFFYHLTTQDWLHSGASRLAFHQYLEPVEKPSARDHAPLNQALAENPGRHVYRAFFFDDETIAANLGFTVLSGYVMLRIRDSHWGLAGFTRAGDDKDRTEGAHMWFRTDAAEPVAINGRKIHPTWGIPFDDIDIRTEMTGEWQPLTSWLRDPVAQEFMQKPECDFSPPR